MTFADVMELADQVLQGSTRNEIRSLLLEVHSAPFPRMLGGAGALWARQSNLVMMDSSLHPSCSALDVVS